MIKYLYVLASDDSDYYLEQALLSITSLRMKMPNAFVSLLIDNNTEHTLVNARRAILDIITELKVITIDPKFGKKARSRWLKTSMRNHIKGDFLYIDCDTVVSDNLDTISELNINIGAVLDKHSLLQYHHAKKNIHKNDKKLHFTSSYKSNKHFNSGVLFCKDIQICHDFFAEWHKLWIISVSKNILIDQPALNEANINFNIIEELNGIWNCQIEFGGIVFLANAKIIHYFSSDMYWKKSYLLANPSCFQLIKSHGYIAESIKKELQNPKAIFNINTRLVSDRKMLSVINSAIFIVLTKIVDTKLVTFFDFLLFKTIYMKRILKKIVSKY
jgi:hypothetical protein